MLKLRYKGIQLWTREIAAIHRAIQRHERCQMLVFGVGHDTPLWLRLNSSGRTTFIEDDERWLERVSARWPSADIRLVSYHTRLRDWPLQIEKPELLEVALPADVTSRKWDVILVDGPKGAPGFERLGLNPPGRGSSILAASRLAAPGGDVLVHDCERPSEDAFTRTYLSNFTLISEIFGRALLRHYRAPNSQ